MDKDLKQQQRDAWLRFVDEVEPLRSDLFRYCLRLTGNPFDAEDLVAEGMLRTFGSIGFATSSIDDTRAYLLRVLSRLWIDETRRSQPVSLADDFDYPGTERADLDAELANAAAHIYTQLNPQQSAIMVLKEVFDLSHKEIAEVLSISVNQAKVTLHRARNRVLANKERRPRASRAMVERFVKVFQTYDVEAIKQMMVEDLEASVFPSGSGVGIEYHVKNGWLRGSFYHHVESRESSRNPYPLALRVEEVLGDQVVLVFRSHGKADARALEEVWLLEEDDGRIARIRDYCFCPDIIEWIADYVNEPVRRLAYRFRESDYAGLA